MHLTNSYIVKYLNLGLIVVKMSKSINIQFNLCRIKSFPVTDVNFVI